MRKLSIKEGISIYAHKSKALTCNLFTMKKKILNFFKIVLVS